MSEEPEPSGGGDASPRRGRGYVGSSTRVLGTEAEDLARHLRRR